MGAEVRADEEDDEEEDAEAVAGAKADCGGGCGVERQCAAGEVELGAVGANAGIFDGRGTGGKTGAEEAGSADAEVAAG